MNITEANDLNVVLRHMLNLPRPSGSTATPDEALAAAQRLADRAALALGAGLDGLAVLAAWPEPDAAAELAEFLGLQAGFELAPWQRDLVRHMLEQRKARAGGEGQVQA